MFNLDRFAALARPHVEAVLIGDLAVALHGMARRRRTEAWAACPKLTRTVLRTGDKPGPGTLA